MKNLKKILIVAITIPFLFACNKSITLDQKNINIEWTAYKTTDKVPVTGIFREIKIENLKSGETPEEVLNGATFSIPVSSLFSNNDDRDAKLQNLFFGVMNNTKLISGKFMHENNVSKLSITLNGVTREIPLETNYDEKAGNVFNVKSTLNLQEFNAQDAIESLNKACYDLHMGVDGVSKTWDEVNVEGTFTFKK